MFLTQLLTGIRVFIKSSSNRRNVQNVTGEYFERGSTSEYKYTVTGYQTFARELSTVNREFSDL